MSHGYSEEQIAAFIAKEAPYHEGGLTREKAIQFMEQRGTAAAGEYTPKRERPRQYEDAYGTTRWSDDGSRVERGTHGGR
jgi:hypothetical protein